MARTGVRGDLDVAGAAKSLFTHPIHLGLGAKAMAEPEFTGAMEWYQDYSARHVDDGAEGRLVSLFRFEEPWTSWEMHPAGEEVVCCLEGSMTLHQQLPDGSERTVDLLPGEYAINPRGTWHTADCEEPVLALFITAGEGTTHRARGDRPLRTSPGHAAGADGAAGED
jgi:mannose-6-phosphate isomerase-like protein (cupin superfamily)